MANELSDANSEAANEKRDESARFEVWMDATRAWWRAWGREEPAACSQAQIGDMMREAFEAGFNTALSTSAAQPEAEREAAAHNEADGCPTEKAVLQREWRRMIRIISGREQLYGGEGSGNGTGMGVLAHAAPLSETPRGDTAKRAAELLEQMAEERRDPCSDAEGNDFYCGSCPAEGGPDECRANHAEILKVARALHSNGGSAKKGWKLVPVEPDYRMVHAGRTVMVTPSGVIETLDLTVIWKAMLAAAPSPDGKEER